MVSLFLPSRMSCPSGSSTCRQSSCTTRSTAPPVTAFPNMPILPWEIVACSAADSTVPGLSAADLSGWTLQSKAKDIVQFPACPRLFCPDPDSWRPGQAHFSSGRFRNLRCCKHDMHPNDCSCASGYVIGSGIRTTFEVFVPSSVLSMNHTAASAGATLSKAVDV